MGGKAFWAAVALCALGASAAGARQSDFGELGSLSLEELSQLTITSVARRRQPISEAAGAVYLVTADDIRRSGATSLPEALRLAPNLWVTRDGASSYAISARGFNSTETANKLLVMIDGRSVYAPLYAGVIWEEEHVLLEDVERIEAANGPGGALWGANAFNGVVNVVTKSSADTQGPAARISAGPQDRAATARYGGRLGEGATYRVYASGFDRENSLTTAGADAPDDYSGVFGGFRADLERGQDLLMIQGDLFDDRIEGGTKLNGGSTTARWRRDFENGAQFTLRGFYDHSERIGPIQDASTDTYDLSFRHAPSPGERHQIVWGGGYRVYTDEFISNIPPFRLDPAKDTIELANLFVQDSLAIAQNIELTLGVKLENSSYSGLEYLPSVRVAWTPSDRLLLWAAASRAVRTPVRLDRDLVADGIFLGGPNYDTEKVVAYEAGYRGRPLDRVSLSVSLFYNDYSDLRTTALSPAGGFPAEFLNGYSGPAYGIEAWGDYQALDWWRLGAGLATLTKDIELDPGATDIADPPSTGNDPEAQLMLRSRMDLGARVTFDAGLRWVDELPRPVVPAYTELNARIAWRATPTVELALSGFDLLDDSHAETSEGGAPFEIPRSVQLEARWRF